ncbi:MAG: chorismate mutase [Streptococcaceae bacterium]|nr:chorismate mutase [Streptococcaceae bacterium]MCL2858306.1 chorismate mutase [Streptococcaceae bacterium]
MSLENIRKEIDHIDAQITQLLEERMDCIHQVANYKNQHQHPVLDQKREDDLLTHIHSHITNEEYQATILSIYRDILKHSRDYQTKKLQ